MNTQQKQVEEPASGLKGKDFAELENMLARAIDDEDYELASKIRDEMNRRT
jgi:protein-arginine kinase activator protein McsA